MPTTRFINASYVRSMLKIARERGVDCDSLLRELGIDMTAIEENQSVSLQVYGKLYQGIADRLSQEWFGMLSGDAVPRGAIRYLCLLAVHCRTLEDAVQRCHEFFELCRGFKIKQSLQRGPQEATFSITNISSVSRAEFDELIENTPPDVIKATLSVLHGFAEWLIGREIPFKAVYYSFPPPPGYSGNPRPYPVHYNADFCGYVIDSGILDSPVIQTEENIDTFSNQAPYFVFLKDHLDQDSLSDRVKAILLKAQGEKTPTAEQLADKLNLSPSSFHRKLKQENTSYQKIKDDLRLEATLYHLSQPNAKTAEIAAQLGFDSPSALYRSFKKWTGMTIKEYRDSLGNGAEPGP